VPYCSRVGSLKVRFMSRYRYHDINQEYRYRYRRYFFEEISLSVSAILFSAVSLSIIGDTFIEYR
jgi:hypothetical protein